MWWAVAFVLVIYGFAILLLAFSIRTDRERLQDLDRGYRVRAEGGGPVASARPSGV